MSPGAECSDHGVRARIVDGVMICVACGTPLPQTAKPVIIYSIRINAEAPPPEPWMTPIPDVAPAPIPDLGSVLAKLLASLPIDTGERKEVLGHWARYCEFLSTVQWPAPADAREKHVRGFLEEMGNAGYGPQSCLKAGRSLQRIYAALVSAGICTTNPVDGINLKE